MSAYQIKRTPFFRRMFNNSRRNGQLQRLREEYERIQEFNDRTIELKMRQVRLKRLFRHIEDINQQETTTLGGGPSSGTPAQSHSVRRQHTLVPMTPEEQLALARRQRLIALERGRELGQEISRQNAQLAENGGGFYMRSELRQTTKVRAAEEARTEALERRQRAARRISYGNAQSRSNIERLVQRRERQRASIVVQSTPSASLLQIGGGNHQQMQLQQRQVAELHPDLVKRAMLQQRLQYGNSRSSSNMQRSQLAAAHRVMNCISTTTDGTPLSLAIAGYNNTSRNSITNNNKDQDSDTDMDMHTAIELPDDDDEMPTTSHGIGMAAAMMEQPNPNPAAAHRWQCFSLTLPWSKIMEEQQQRPAAAAAQFGTNISITIDNNDELGHTASSLQATQQDTATGTTDNTYHSMRGPSLLQEDLLQILELDNGNGQGQMPSLH